MNNYVLLGGKFWKFYQMLVRFTLSEHDWVNRQDWVNRLSKGWMLDYSLYKIIDIDVPLSSHVDKYYNVLTLFERCYSNMLFNRKEVATAQIPCVSDISR